MSIQSYVLNGCIILIMIISHEITLDELDTALHNRYLLLVTGALSCGRADKCACECVV